MFQDNHYQQHPVVNEFQLADHDDCDKITKILNVLDHKGIYSKLILIVLIDFSKETSTKI
jgi:hypothetical protein